MFIPDNGVAYGKPMEIYGKPMMEQLWENNGFDTKPASCHRYSMCFPCISTGFPHVISQLKLTYVKPARFQ